MSAVDLFLLTADGEEQRITVHGFDRPSEAAASMGRFMERKDVYLCDADGLDTARVRTIRMALEEEAARASKAAQKCNELSALLRDAEGKLRG